MTSVPTVNSKINMTDKTLEEKYSELQSELSITKLLSDHYSELASKLVKKVLLLERRYDRRFLYPEEYK